MTKLSRLLFAPLLFMAGVALCPTSVLGAQNVWTFTGVPSANTTPWTYGGVTYGINDIPRVTWTQLPGTSFLQGGDNLRLNGYEGTLSPGGQFAFVTAVLEVSEGGTWSVLHTRYGASLLRSYSELGSVIYTLDVTGRILSEHYYTIADLATLLTGTSVLDTGFSIMAFQVWGADPRDGFWEGTGVWSGSSSDPLEVPEPTPASLVLLGILGISACAWRRSLGSTAAVRSR